MIHLLTTQAFSDVEIIPIMANDSFINVLQSISLLYIYSETSFLFLKKG